MFHETLTPARIRTAKRELQADPKLALLMKRVGAFKLQPEPGQPPFRRLVRAVIYQLLSTKAAATIEKRVQLLVGTKPTPESILAVPRSELRAAGLSWAKADALRDLSQKALEGLVPSQSGVRRLSNDELIARLTQVRGVGRWTVEMLLIFGLGRADVLPVGDLGVRRGYQLAYGKRKLPEARHLAEIGSVWAPHRSVAAWYLWRANDLDW